jgi:AcrR family transcriptional regulator
MPLVRKVDPVKHEQKRRDILHAAFRCFLKDGFHGASTSDICAAANISPGHLYHYFESKEAIVEAIVDQGLARTAKRLGQVLSAPDVIEALLEYLEQESLRFRTAQVFNIDSLAEAARNPQFARIVERHTNELRSLLANFLEQAQLQGQIDTTLDANATSNILIAIIDGVRAMPIRTPKLDIEQSIVHLRTLLSRLLKPVKASRKRSARTREANSKRERAR